MNHHNKIAINWTGHKIRSKLLTSQQHTLKTTDNIQFADIKHLEAKLKGSRLMLNDKGYRAGGYCCHFFLILQKLHDFFVQIFMI